MKKLLVFAGLFLVILQMNARAEEREKIFLKSLIDESNSKVESLKNREIDFERAIRDIRESRDRDRKTT